MTIPIPDDFKFWIGIGVGYALFRQMGRDVNGLGRKTRVLTAELIIAAKDRQDFADMVRKLVIGG